MEQNSADFSGQDICCPLGLPGTQQDFKGLAWSKGRSQLARVKQSSVFTTLLCLWLSTWPEMNSPVLPVQILLSNGQTISQKQNRGAFTSRGPVRSGITHLGLFFCILAFDGLSYYLWTFVFVFTSLTQ